MIIWVLKKSSNLFCSNDRKWQGMDKHPAEIGKVVVTWFRVCQTDRPPGIDLWDR